MNQWKDKLTYYFYDWLRIAQSLLLRVSLFLVYFLGIGMTKLLVNIFSAKHMAPFRVKKSLQTYWVDAKNYHDSSHEQHQKQV